MSVKILFPVGYLFPSENGGPALTLYWMGKALHEKGITPTFVTSSKYTNHKIKTDEWLETDYGKVIYVDSKGDPDYSLKQIRTAIRQIPFHYIVSLTSFFAFSSLIIGCTAIFRRKKVIWSPRGELSRDALVYGYWKKRIILFLIKRIVRNKVLFHVTSKEEKEQCKYWFGNGTRIVELPNFMIIPDQINRPNSEEPYFLYLGRFHPVKGIDRLLKAIQQSHTFQNSSYKFIFAGDHTDEYGQKIVSLAHELGITEKVNFVGVVGGVQKQRLISGAQYLFLPSHSENFGNVVVEALAQGTPVIASKGTPWEILETYGAGFWCQNTPEELANMIDQVALLDTGEYEHMRNQAYRLAHDEFDIWNNIHRWIKVYEQIVESK